MNNRALVETFVKQGWVRVENAIPKKAVAPVAKRALERYAALPPAPPDPQDRPMGRTLPHERGYLLSDLCPQVLDLVHELCGGADRIADSALSFSDGFVVAAPGSKKWTEPDPYHFSWHIDGEQNQMRRPDSPEVGLLLYSIWNDVAPRGGGTFFAPGATPVLARHLSSRQDGWLKADLPYELCLLAAPGGPRYFEFTGAAGTVLITHPLLIHAPSWNATKSARLLATRIVPFKERLRLSGIASDSTPVERFTILAINSARPGAK